LSQSRIVALSSGNEGVPTALLEAMAAARPVVTTDAGHVRSIVTDGTEGFVVRIGDVDALADRLMRLLAYRELARVMGANGRARARQHAVERIADRLGAFLLAQASTQ
jgi:glycosyltransferase involved in cell wall biosynthesis